VKYKQAEIEDPSDEKYLGLSVGRDWVIDDVADDTSLDTPVTDDPSVTT
jgi:NCS1 family nucleobase:cation symporter-1